MTYGITIKNESTGTVQIDENYKNYCLVQKSTVTPNGLGEGSVSYTGNAPILAVACGANSTVLWTTGLSGSTWTWYLKAGAPTPYENIICYVFDVSPAASSSGMALVVKDGSGATCYDSRNKYLTIAGIMEGSTYSNTSPPSTTMASGRTYAVLMGKLSGRSNGFSGSTVGGYYTWNTSTYGLGCKVNGNTISSSEITLASNYYSGSFGGTTAGGFAYDFKDYRWLIADVTGY